MNNTKTQKKAIILIFFAIACCLVMGSLLPTLQFTSMNASKVTNMSNTSTSSDNIIVSNVNDSVSTYAYGGISDHYVAGIKTVYIRIDARDTMFGDDVVLDFSCNVYVTVAYTVDFMLNGVIRKTRSWSGAGTSGGQILNSGMTKIDKIVVTFTIDGQTTYQEDFLQY